jgi:hypothetical protein
MGLRWCSPRSRPRGRRCPHRMLPGGRRQPQVAPRDGSRTPLGLVSGTRPDSPVPEASVGPLLGPSPGERLEVAARTDVARPTRRCERRAEQPDHAGAYRPWAELLARTFAVDVLACPTCQGRMKLLVKRPASIARYLATGGEAPRSLGARRVAVRPTGRAACCASRWLVTRTKAADAATGPARRSRSHEATVWGGPRGGGACPWLEIGASEPTQDVGGRRCRGAAARPKAGVGRPRRRGPDWRLVLVSPTLSGALPEVLDHHEVGALGHLFRKENRLCVR